MKIISLKSENIKRLSAVEITPEGNVVKISGKNAQGKSSILDSIFWALGGEKVIQGKPIREGADKACITLDLGDLVVERRFTQKASTLTVKNKDGAKFSSPQKMLDELVGRLTFDPLEFMRMDAKKQADTLRDLCGLDFTALDSQRKEFFEERAATNRQVKDLSGQLKAIVVPEDAPDEEIDVADLAAQITAGNAHNAKISAMEATQEQRRQKIHQVRELQQKLAAELEEAKLAEAELIKAGSAAKVEIEAMVPVDLASLQHQINNAKAINEGARAKAEYDRVKLAHDTASLDAETLTENIAEVDSRKAAMIREAKLPVDGLGFADDGSVTYNGIPLSQSSSAEQLRVSIAMAMSLNPKLRVLRITDGSLLDSESWKIVEKMAADGDYQAWCECVDETGLVGVYIEDGHVSAVNGVAVALEPAE